MDFFKFLITGEDKILDTTSFHVFTIK